MESSEVLDEDNHSPRLKVTYEDASTHYDVKGNKWMFIFNHKTFEKTRVFRYSQKSRAESDEDVARLSETFRNVGFQVHKPYNDFTYEQILNKLQEFCEMDHRNTSCVAIVLLTHGDSRGAVSAADKPYLVSDVVNLMLHAPNLAGKPKLFFTPSCKNRHQDRGHRVFTHRRVAVHIPTHADSLMMTSFEPYRSYHARQSSLMVQTLCDVISKHHYEYDILDMMTLVKQRVDDVSNFKYAKKQMEVKFTLTKMLNL